MKLALKEKTDRCDGVATIRNREELDVVMISDDGNCQSIMIHMDESGCMNIDLLDASVNVFGVKNATIRGE